MSGILFDEIVFGPVKSRRFGVSLGINLLPLQTKICTFDCIYCECGLTENKKQEKPHFFTATEIKESLENRFKALVEGGLKPDTITFAGNGEPTLHPDFSAIIDNTLVLRNQYFPGAKITVLSNATRLHNPKVHEALLKIDNNVLKLDAGTNETFQAINRPNFPISLSTVVEQLSLFHGDVTIQTMLIRGDVDGNRIDNTTENELKLYCEHLIKIKPKLVMLYPIDRQTPYRTLEKVPLEEFNSLIKQIEALGISAEVYY